MSPWGEARLRRPAVASSARDRLLVLLSGVHSRKKESNNKAVEDETTTTGDSPVDESAPTEDKISSAVRKSPEAPAGPRVPSGQKDKSDGNPINQDGGAPAVSIHKYKVCADGGRKSKDNEDVSQQKHRKISAPTHTSVVGGTSPPTPGDSPPQGDTPAAPTAYAVAAAKSRTLVPPSPSTCEDSLHGSEDSGIVPTPKMVSNVRPSPLVIASAPVLGISPSSIPPSPAAPGMISPCPGAPVNTLSYAMTSPGEPRSSSSRESGGGSAALPPLMRRRSWDHGLGTGSGASSSGSGRMMSSPEKGIVGCASGRGLGKRTRSYHAGASPAAVGKSVARMAEQTQQDLPPNMPNAGKRRTSGGQIGLKPTAASPFSSRTSRASVEDKPPTARPVSVPKTFSPAAALVTDRKSSTSSRRGRKSSRHRLTRSDSLSVIGARPKFLAGWPSLSLPTSCAASPANSAALSSASITRKTVVIENRQKLGSGDGSISDVESAGRDRAHSDSAVAPVTPGVAARREEASRAHGLWKARTKFSKLRSGKLLPVSMGWPSSFSLSRRSGNTTARSRSPPPDDAQVSPPPNGTFQAGKTMAEPERRFDKKRPSEGSSRDGHMKISPLFRHRQRRKAVNGGAASAREAFAGSFGARISKFDMHKFHQRTFSWAGGGTNDSYGGGCGTSSDTGEDDASTRRNGDSKRWSPDQTLCTPSASKRYSNTPPAPPGRPPHALRRPGRGKSRRGTVIEGKDNQISSMECSSFSYDDNAQHDQHDPSTSLETAIGIPPGNQSIELEPQAGVRCDIALESRRTQGNQSYPYPSNGEDDLFFQRCQRDQPSHVKGEGVDLISTVIENTLERAVTADGTNVRKHDEDDAPIAAQDQQIATYDRTAGQQPTLSMTHRESPSEADLLAEAVLEEFTIANDGGFSHDEEAVLEHYTVANEGAGDINADDGVADSQHQEDASNTAEAFEDRLDGKPSLKARRGEAFIFCNGTFQRVVAAENTTELSATELPSVSPPGICLVDQAKELRARKLYELGMTGKQGDKDINELQHNNTDEKSVFESEEGVQLAGSRDDGPTDSDHLHDPGHKDLIASDQGRKQQQHVTRTDSQPPARDFDQEVHPMTRTSSISACSSVVVDMIDSGNAEGVTSQHDAVNKASSQTTRVWRNHRADPNNPAASAAAARQSSTHFNASSRPRGTVDDPCCVVINRGPTRVKGITGPRLLPPAKQLRQQDHVSSRLPTSKEIKSSHRLGVATDLADGKEKNGKVEASDGSCKVPLEAVAIDEPDADLNVGRQYRQPHQQQEDECSEGWESFHSAYSRRSGSSTGSLCHASGALMSMSSSSLVVPSSRGPGGAESTTTAVKVSKESSASASNASISVLGGCRGAYRARGGSQGDRPWRIQETYGFAGFTGRGERDNCREEHSGDIAPSSEGEGLVVGRGVTVHADIRVPFGTVAVTRGGELKGQVCAKEFLLEDGGRLEGEVECDFAVIEGNLDASLLSREVATVGPAARVLGDVIYNVLELDRGAVITGRLFSLRSETNGSPAHSKRPRGHKRHASADTGYSYPTEDTVRCRDSHGWGWSRKFGASDVATAIDPSFSDDESSDGSRGAASRGLGRRRGGGVGKNEEGYHTSDHGRPKGGLSALWGSVIDGVGYALSRALSETSITAASPRSDWSPATGDHRWSGDQRDCQRAQRQFRRWPSIPHEEISPRLSRQELAERSDREAKMRHVHLWLRAAQHRSKLT